MKLRKKESNPTEYCVKSWIFKVIINNFTKETKITIQTENSKKQI